MDFNFKMPNFRQPYKFVFQDNCDGGGFYF